MSEELVGRGHAALRAGDVGEARRVAETLATEGPAAGEALELMARADYLDLKFAEAIEHWERAYAAYRAAGDRVGAIRVARTIAGMYFAVVGDFAVSRGWHTRASTLLEGAGETSERGWVALNAGMFEPDRTQKHERYRQALADARASGDVALEVATLGYYGASLVHADAVDEGMAMLDEALAALAGNEVDDFFVIEEVFCQLFSACEHAHDVGRAEEWMRVGEAIAARRNLPSVSAFCRTHYGGVLTAAGRWDEADSALSEAVGLWQLGHRSLLRGGALVRLAELRVRQGRYEEAEQLLAEVDPAAEGEAARPRAAVLLANGEPALAREVLERALAAMDAASSDAAPLLELLVEATLADGDVVAAHDAVEQLSTAAARHEGPYVESLAALARGHLCLATGAGDPQTCLREALSGFARAQLPLEVARARLELARVLAAGRPEVARSEARAALDTFEQLKAVRYRDQAAALLRELGVRPSTARGTDGTPLTKREAEVLELLGEGLSNPEIAERLFISRKTVEHHVGNVLAKLGLRSRAQAAAYAIRHSRDRAGEPARD